MRGVSSRHPFVTWEKLHVAKQTVQALIDEEPDEEAVAWDDALQGVAVEVANSKKQAKNLLKMLHDLRAVEIADTDAEGKFYVSMQCSEYQNNAVESEAGAA